MKSTLIDLSDYLDQPRQPRRKGRKTYRSEAKERVQPPPQIEIPFEPLNAAQAEYMESLREATQVFVIGEAGTGKTYIASRHAARQLKAESVEKITITRPTIARSKHKMGFLPGKAEEKMTPWLKPIMQGLRDEFTAREITRMMADEVIEILPFEHMRGVTVSNSVFILDEAQNCDEIDLRMFLTRVGENTQVIVCGDVNQVDIPGDSGLPIVVEMIERYDIPADIIEFTADDVVRSATAKSWVKAFAKKAEEAKDE